MLRGIICVFVLWPALAFAALDEFAVKKAVAGKYRIAQGKWSVEFSLLRGGDVSISKGFSGTVTMNASYGGLTVLHVVIGREEDGQDFHFILTAIEDDEPVPTLVAKFSATNAELGAVNFKVLKYRYDEFVELRVP